MDEYQQAAERMVRTQLRPRGIRQPEVINAMLEVPRHLFVPGLPANQAYGDHALPTSDGQTISQPFVVAHMTQCLDIRPGMKVLEIGTGTGYQAAILATMGAHVTSIEAQQNLARSARHRLARFFPDLPIQVHLGDGSLGYEPAAPYDRIIVTAAAPSLPAHLDTQLAPEGKLLIPLGSRSQQTLTLFELANDQLHRRSDLPCRFVPLIGAAAWPP